MSDAPVDIFALSPVQELMLLHDLASPASNALTSQFHYRLTGTVDVEALQAAWQGLVCRHPAWRTAFVWDGLKRPVQVVHRQAELPFEYVDLSQLAAPEREARLEDIRLRDWQRGFDLLSPPLVRVSLVRLADDECRLLWNRHHLVADRWCVDLVFDELFERYEAGRRGSTRKSPEAVGFRGYVAWIQRQDPAEAEAYWRRQLQGLATPTLLFPHRGRRVTAGQAGLPVTSSIPDSSMGAALRAYAARHQVSVATVLQCAVALLVGAWTGREEAVFGLTVSGRPPELPGVETTMGSFINNVPVRASLAPSARIADCLQAILDAQAKRMRYDYLSLAQITALSAFSPHQPPFDLLALLHAPPVETRPGPGFTVEQIASPYDGAYPFTLSLAETQGRLRFDGGYDPTVVSRDRSRQLLDDLQSIVAAILDPSTIAVADVIPRIRPPASIAVRPVASLSRPVGPHVDGPTADLPALEETTGVVAQIWKEVLGIDRLSLDDDFFALGGTSLQAARMLASLERQTGLVLPLSTLVRSGSIRTLLEVAGSLVPDPQVVIEMQSRGSRPRLFVVPAIGGHTVGLVPLARALGSDQPFFGLEAKGLDGLEPLAATIEEQSSQFLEAMAPLHGPVVLMGVCWGAAVAFEMAQALARAGRPPLLLILLDSTIGSDAGPPIGRASRVTTLIRHSVDRLRIYGGELRRSRPGERTRWLKGKATRLLGALMDSRARADARFELQGRHVKAVHLEAERRYHPVAYEGPTAVFLTTGRDSDPEADGRLRCLQLVPAHSPIRFVRGLNTGDALSRSNVTSIADHIREEIDRVMHVASSSAAIRLSSG